MALVFEWKMTAIFSVFTGGKKMVCLHWSQIIIDLKRNGKTKNENACGAMLRYYIRNIFIVVCVFFFIRLFFSLLI